MRMFFTGLTDLFLILYLTSIASNPAPSGLTVDDFYKLKSLHETMQTEKDKSEQDFEDKLRLAGRQLVHEQARVKEAEASLRSRDEKLAQIDQDLRLKDDLLKEKEQALAQLDQAIKDKEASWQTKEATYKTAVGANQMLARKLALEARKAQLEVDQVQKQAAEAGQTAREAQVAQQKALALKEAALQEKDEAERRALEALEARSKAESAKDAALKAAREANRIKEAAQKKAGKLAVAIEGIQQDSREAYQKNVRPLMQRLTVTYEAEVSKNTTAVYKRELDLLPVQINGQVFVFFPSQHAGFSRRYDSPPKGLEIIYKGKKITRVWMNMGSDLIAVALPGYNGRVSRPQLSIGGIDQLMPVLLALRDNADRDITNLFRGLSADYFVVSRDNLTAGEKGEMVHFIKGWRGTGKRAERVMQGDQLVDLNARFIGIAKDADHIVRINTLKGWEERAL